MKECGNQGFISADAEKILVLIYIHRDNIVSLFFNVCLSRRTSDALLISKYDIRLIYTHFCKAQCNIELCFMLKNDYDSKINIAI